MLFSKTCEYAIRATVHIAHQSQLQKRSGLKEIAGAIDSPEAFTAKILQQLVKNDIVKSVKGPSGGFEIEPETMKKLKLHKVIEAIDGNGVFKDCGLGLRDCNEKNPCPIHNQFKPIREQLNKIFFSTSIEDLADKMQDGVTFLKL